MVLKSGLHMYRIGRTIEKKSIIKHCRTQKMNYTPSALIIKHMPEVGLFVIYTHDMKLKT